MVTLACNNAQTVLWIQQNKSLVCKQACLKACNITIVHLYVHKFKLYNNNLRKNETFCGGDWNGVGWLLAVACLWTCKLLENMWQKPSTIISKLFYSCIILSFYFNFFLHKFTENESFPFFHHDNHGSRANCMFY